MNEETTYVLKIIISMIPVGFAGFFLKDPVEKLFDGNMISLGIDVLVTAVFLAASSFH